MTTEQIIDWIPLTGKEALDYMEELTSVRFPRSVFYTWAKKGQLQTNGFRPLATTRKLLRVFAMHYLKLEIDESR